jgi:hypothetical protein
MARVGHVSYDYAEDFRHGANNAWNVNFSNGNVNNNNRTNTNRVRPVAEFNDLRLFVNSFFEAYDDCLKNKKSSPQAIEYMPKAADDIPVLAREIWERRYKPGMSTCFMVTYPKLREVFAAAFRDRIVHHWICNRLSSLFEERCMALGDCAHACRKGRGTTYSVEHLKEGIKKVTRNHTREAWIYKGDIVGFFMHIDRALLWEMLRKLITDKYTGDNKETLLYLTEIIVKHEPQKNCIVNSEVDLWRHIAANKSLFFIEPGKGEPIGNLTTQFFAGYYMSFLDEYIHHLFKGRNYHYTRYVDDFVIVCDDRSFLKHSIGLIADFAHRHLKLETHRDNIYFQPASHGVKFVGRVIKGDRVYLSNRTVWRMEQAVMKCIAECRAGMTALGARRWRCTLNSYYGFMAGTMSYNIRKRILAKYTEEFFQVFTVVNNKKLTIKKQYRYKYDD